MANEDYNKVDDMGYRYEDEPDMRINQSNPVLIAFGNANPVKNNNSSRFGNFVEIQFDLRRRISGATIKTYLLERSRVCQVSDPEKNYHCFCMLCAAREHETERYKLGKQGTFRYMNQSNCYVLDGLDDSKEYLATRKAMDVLGINSEECDENALEDSLCKRVMVTRDRSITKLFDLDNAARGRDALAKIVYSKFFDWFVSKINDSSGQDPNSKHIISSRYLWIREFQNK